MKVNRETEKYVGRVVDTKRERGRRGWRNSTTSKQQRKPFSVNQLLNANACKPLQLIAGNTGQFIVVIHVAKLGVVGAVET